VTASRTTHPAGTTVAQGAEPQRLLAELLGRVVAGHDDTAMDEYLHPEFRLWCNGTAHDRASFAGRVATALAGNLGYAIDVDDQAWVTGADRVAARIWVSSTPSAAEPSDTEVLLIATVRDGRFDRAWVLAWPDRPRLHHLPDPIIDRPADGPGSSTNGDTR
jgi:hypothetical protein